KRRSSFGRRLGVIKTSRNNAYTTVPIVPIATAIVAQVSTADSSSACRSTSLVSAIARRCGYRDGVQRGSRLAFEKDGEPDRALEQRPHRKQLQECRHRVRPRKCERDDRDDEVSDAAVLAQRPGVEDAQADEPDHHEW